MDPGLDSVFTERERRLIEVCRRGDDDRRLTRIVLWGAVFAVGLLGFAAFSMASPFAVFLAGTVFIVVTMIERMTIAYANRRYRVLVAKLVLLRESKSEADAAEGPPPEG